MLRRFEEVALFHRSFLMNEGEHDGMPDALGDQLGDGSQLSTAIIVVLGIRIFGNAAALRRRLFGA